LRHRRRPADRHPAGHRHRAARADRPPDGHRGRREEPATGGDVSIPAPPDSEAYKAGDDPAVDAAVTAMETEFAKQSGTGLDLEDLTFYTSSSSVDDVVTFYEAEMPNNGWVTGQTQDQDFGKVLAYVASDLETVGLIGILDLEKAGASGLIVFTTQGKSTTGGSTGGVEVPTLEPLPTIDLGGSTGGETSSDLGDIPAPPNSELYTEGDDAATDAFVSAFTEAFKGSSGTTNVIAQEEFIVDGTAAELKTFYDDEMAKLGWTSSDPGNTTEGQVLSYTRVNGSEVEVALISSADRADYSSNTGLIVIIVVIKS
jgi:hypothetical protein